MRKINMGDDVECFVADGDPADLKKAAAEFTRHAESNDPTMKVQGVIGLATLTCLMIIRAAPHAAAPTAATLHALAGAVNNVFGCIPTEFQAEMRELYDKQTLQFERLRAAEEGSPTTVQ